MTPVVGVLREATDAILAMSERHRYLPSATSRAMAELAQEQQSFGRWSTWDGPLTDTHTFGGITLLAACDYVKAFAALFDAEHPPAYGHMVLARAAMEAFVVSEWLNEPAIEPLDRIQRGLVERIYSAREQSRIDPLRDQARQLEQEMRAVSARFGWEVTIGRNNKVTVGNVGRPSIPQKISQLVVQDSEQQLGRVEWSYLSSIVHVTWYGLRQSVDPPAAQTGLGPSLGQIGTSTSAVNAHVVCLLRLLRAAASARHTLMGWSSDDWTTAESRSRDLENAIIRSTLQYREDGQIDDEAFAAVTLPQPPPVAQSP
jgi:hypothetical protein